VQGRVVLEPVPADRAARLIGAGRVRV
jgi:hypothetical protein